MNKLKMFSEFYTHTKGSEKELFNKIQVIGESSSYVTPFKRIDTLEESNGTPILMLSSIKLLNESNVNDHIFYNNSNFNKKTNPFTKFIKESFIPKSTTVRKNVKRLKFPIVASLNGKETIYETYHRFKKSESNYTKFREKIIPKTKYDILFLNNKPVSVCENINDKLISKKIDSSFNKSLTHVSKKILEKYKLDTFYIRLNEDARGKLYLNKLNSIQKLNENQSNLLYIALYENYYKHSLPQWFKNKLTSI
jgi:hypothetical protein